MAPHCPVSVNRHSYTARTSRYARNLTAQFDFPSRLPAPASCPTKKHPRTAVRHYAKLLPFLAYSLLPPIVAPARNSKAHTHSPHIHGRRTHRTFSSHHSCPGSGAHVIVMCCMMCALYVVCDHDFFAGTTCRHGGVKVADARTCTARSPRPCAMRSCMRSHCNA